MATRGVKPGHFEWETPSRLMYLRSMAMEGKTNEEIASEIGVATSTFNEWRKKSAKISDAIKTGKEEADALVEHSLYKQAMAGEGWAVCFWLKNRQPGKWRDKQEIELETKHVVIYDGVPDDDE